MLVRTVLGLDRITPADWDRCGARYDLCAIKETGQQLADVAIQLPGLATLLEPVGIERPEDVPFVMATQAEIPARPQAVKAEEGEAQICPGCPQRSLGEARSPRGKVAPLEPRDAERIPEIGIGSHLAGEICLNAQGQGFVAIQKEGEVPVRLHES